MGTLEHCLFLQTAKWKFMGRSGIVLQGIGRVLEDRSERHEGFSLFLYLGLL